MRTSDEGKLESSCGTHAEGTGVGVNFKFGSGDTSDVVCFSALVQDVKVVTAWFFADFASEALNSEHSAEVVETDGVLTFGVLLAKMMGRMRAAGCWRGN